MVLTVRNSLVGRHNSKAAHRGKAVVSVFIQLKTKNQADKTQSRSTKSAGKISNSRKRGTEVKTQEVNPTRQAKLEARGRLIYTSGQQ